MNARPGNETAPRETLRALAKPASAWAWLAVVFAIVFVSWAVYGWLLLRPSLPLESPASAEARGQFGDGFGALNALFSGLAFGAVAVTLFLQRQDLALQRDDLRTQQQMLAAQLEEMREQRGEMEKQRAAMDAQTAATLEHARATYHLSEVNITQGRAALRPYVVVLPEVRLGESIFFLRITNSGRTVAKNVRLSIDRDFFQWGRRDDARNLANMSAFTTPIDSMPPGFQLLFGLAQDFVVFGSGGETGSTPQQFNVRAEYEWGDHRYNEVTPSICARS